MADALPFTLREIDQELASQKTLRLYAAFTVLLFAALLYQRHAAGKTHQRNLLNLALVLTIVYLGDWVIVQLH